MKITKIICKTCKREFDSVRAHKQFCSRKCYKNDVHVKAKYADRTKVYLKKYNLEAMRPVTMNYTYSASFSTADIHIDYIHIKYGKILQHLSKDEIIAAHLEKTLEDEISE